MLAGTVSGTRWQSSSAPPGEALPGSRGRLQGLSSRTTGRCLISLSLVSGVLQKLLVCPQVWQVQVWIPTLSWRHQHPSKVSPGRREALSKKPRCLDVCAARGRDSQPSTFSPRRGVPSHPNGSLPSADQPSSSRPCRSVRRDGLFSESAAGAQSECRRVSSSRCLRASPSPHPSTQAAHQRGGKGRNGVLLAVFGGRWVVPVLPKRRLGTGQSRAAEALVVLCYEPSCLSGALP